MEKKKRIVFPAFFLLVVLGGGAGVWVRGSWADGIVKTPSTAKDGLVRQLLLTPEGRRIVRGAQVVDAPIEKVWSVITDYDHFAEFMPNIASMSSSVAADGRIELTGTVATFVGAFPIDLHVKHDPSTFTTSWDESTGAFTANRGHWALSRAAGGGTLVVYELDLEVKGWPAPAVRTVLLHRLRKIFAALAKRSH